MAQHERPHEAPPANKTLQWIAGILLMLPVIAILWVSTYSKETPKIGPFPFFIWYQMAWVLGTAVCTTVAYVLVQRSRTERPRFVDHDVTATHKGGTRTAEPTMIDTTVVDTTDRPEATR